MFIEAEISHDTICLGESVGLQVNATGGSGNYSYNWSPSDIIDDPNAASTSAIPTELGDNIFKVTVYDGEYSKDAELSVYVCNCENVQEYDYDDVTIYPNPANELINIDIEQSYKELYWSLYNVQGQIVGKSSQESDCRQINVENLSSGLYYLNIVVDGKQMMKKVVIE